MLRPFARGLILPMLSTWLNATFVIYNILWNPNAGSRTVLMNIDALFLTPQIVTSKPQLKNAFSTFPICYLSQLKHLDMNAFIPGKHARRTSFIKPKLSSLWEVKPRANGPNIVGQQLSTLLDVTCCVRLHTLLHWSVACCCAKFEAGQTFQPTTPNISFVPWSLITHGLQRLMGCILPTMQCRSQHCWELLHPFANHCQHARNNFQHRWRNNVRSWELLRPCARRLSNLGDLSNLIGLLSRTTIEQYSPPRDWIMCKLGVFPIF